MKRVLTFPICALVLAIQACNLPTLTPKSPIKPTSTTAAVPVLDTATAPELPVVASPQINDLQMLDASTGWAIGNGTIMRTDDGGTTWLDVSPSGLSSSDVVAGR